VWVPGEAGVPAKVWAAGEVWLRCSGDPKPRCAWRQSWDLTVPMTNRRWAPAPSQASSRSDLPVFGAGGGQERRTFLCQSSEPSCPKSRSWWALGSPSHNWDALPRTATGQSQCTPERPPPHLPAPGGCPAGSGEGPRGGSRGGHP